LIGKGFRKISGTSFDLLVLVWSGRRDLNPRPLDPTTSEYAFAQIRGNFYALAIVL